MAVAGGIAAALDIGSRWWRRWRSSRLRQQQTAPWGDRSSFIVMANSNAARHGLDRMMAVGLVVSMPLSTSEAAGGGGGARATQQTAPWGDGRYPPALTRVWGR